MDFAKQNPMSWDFARSFVQAGKTQGDFAAAMGDGYQPSFIDLIWAKAVEQFGVPKVEPQVHETWLAALPGSELGVLLSVKVKRITNLTVTLDVGKASGNLYGRHFERNQIRFVEKVSE